MKYLPPLKSLQYFMHAAQMESFKEAALKLNVTQAAISQQIRLLETHLQQPLFVRHGKKIRLTEQGAKLLPYLIKGFDQFTQGIQDMAGDSKPDVLRISTLHSFSSLWLIPKLNEFQRNHPQLMIQLAPTNQVIDFQHDDIDLAIRMGPGGYEPLMAKPLVDDHLILAASPNLADSIDIMDPKDVFSLPWIEDLSEGAQLAIAQCCNQYNVNRSTLVPIIRTEDSVPLIENIVAGRGFAMVNSGMIAEHLIAGRLIKLLDFSTISPYKLFLVAPEQHFSWHKVKVFEKWFIPALQASFDPASFAIT